MSTQKIRMSADKNGFQDADNIYHTGICGTCSASLVQSTEIKINPVTIMTLKSQVK